MDNITYSKQGRTYIKVDDTPSQRDIPRISITEIAQGIDHDQLCRTCAHTNDRLWDLSFTERSHAVSNNLQSEAQCSPDNGKHIFKHGADGIRFEEWTRSSGAKIIGMVESCGWTLNSKCSSCVHFSNVTISQPYEQWDGGPVRYRQLTVAGHCKLASSCSYKRRPRAVDPSCLNCEYLVYTFGDKFITDEYGREVVKAALDPYEMIQVRKAVSAASASDGSGAHPGVVFNKYTSLYTSNHNGLYRYFYGRLLNVRTKDGETIVANAAVGMNIDDIDSIEVTFADDRTWWFPTTVAEDNEPVGSVYWGTRSDAHFGYVRFYGTGYTKYGIAPSNTIKNYNFMSTFGDEFINSVRHMNHSEWTCNHGQSYREALANGNPGQISHFHSNRCSVCMRSSMYVHNIKTPDYADRADEHCNFCRSDRACDAHARLLTRVTKDDEEYWYFADPNARGGFDIHSTRQSVLSVEGRLVDQDGGPLHPARVLSSARSLIDNAIMRYTVRVKHVTVPSDFIVDKSREEIAELVPYVEELRAELNSGDSPHKELIERVIKKLERRISIATSWLRAHDDAKNKIQMLKSQLDDTLRSVYEAKQQALAGIPTKPNSRVPYDVGWGAPMSVEPFKHYCALSFPRVIHSQRDGVSIKRHIPAGLRGIDFREVMGDTFGAMRGTQTSIASRGSKRGKITRFNPRTGETTEHTMTQRLGTYKTDSWVDIMAMDERIRGTNPLERLQEEILVNEAMVYDRNADRIEIPESTEWRVVKLDMGITESETDETLSWTPMGKSIDDWAVYTPEADRALYLQWLDQKVDVVMHTAEIHVEDDITRDDIQLGWSNRWRIHGYENYRGHARRSSNDDAMVFSFNHQRQTSDELRSTTLHSFVCNLCDATFSNEELVEDSNCPDCDVPLIWVETSHEDTVSVSLSQLPDIPKGRQMGIGFAVAADSPRYQNETRLTRMCCDNWTLRGSASNARPTRLNDI